MVQLWDPVFYALYLWSKTTPFLIESNECDVY